MTKLLETQPGDFIQLMDGLTKTGLFGFGMNEIGLRSLVGDPPKWALEFSEGGSASWNARYVRRSADGTILAVIEIALIQFKKDERTRGRDDVVWGEWTIHMKGPGRYDGDDGMVLVFLCTHDYLWHIGQPGPSVPPIALPPPTEPPADDWTSTANVATHNAELDAIDREFFAVCGDPLFVIDAKSREAYVSGRNKDLKSLHDDQQARQNGLHAPELHPPNAPY
jgi:hypothetical protein